MKEYYDKTLIPIFKTIFIGMVFYDIDGEDVEHNLQAGEKRLLDLRHIAAIEESVEFDIECVKGTKNIIFRGELFFIKLSGLGKDGYKLWQ